MRFDAERALDFARALDFPRPAGGDGECLAADRIAEAFGRAGLRVDRRALEAPPACPEWMLLLVSLCGAWARPAFRDWPETARLAIGAAGVVLPLVLLLGQVVVGRAFRLRSSLVLGDSPGAAEASSRVLLVTRLDTPPTRRALRLHAGFRGACLAMASALLALGLGGAFGPMARLGPPLFLGLWATSLLLVVRPWSRAPSPRVGDNRTGLAVLVELARARPDRPREALEYRFATTGAGLAGLRSLAKLVAREWPSKPTLVVELAAPGAGPSLTLLGRGPAPDLARAAARDLWMPLRDRIGPLPDLGPSPFARFDLPSVRLVGDSEADRIDPVLLAATAQLISEVSLRWARLHSPVTTTRIGQRGL